MWPPTLITTRAMVDTVSDPDGRKAASRAEQMKIQQGGLCNSPQLENMGGRLATAQLQTFRSSQT